MREREAVGDVTARWSERGCAKRAGGDMESNTAEMMCHATKAVIERYAWSME
jgi:hypothetical protein